MAKHLPCVAGMLVICTHRYAAIAARICTHAGAGSGRQRRAQAVQEDPMKRYADKQALREELTRLWSGLLDAQHGDCLVRKGGGQALHEAACT